MRRSAMRTRTGVAAALSLLLVCAPRASGQEGEALDAVTAAPEQFTVILENDHVRVIGYSLEPGETDAWHTHPAKVSYVVSGGTLEVTLDDGETIMVEETAGTASWSDGLGRHTVENIGDTPVSILLVEVKAAASSGGVVAGRDAGRHLIMIDPGHGGSEPGVQTAGLEEKNIVLGLGFVLAAEYARRGYDVMFTRSGDYEVGWGERRTMAEEVGAALLVSLHFRGGDDAEAHGITIFANVDHAHTSAAAETMAESLRETGWPVAVEKRDFGFLNSPTVPTLMVEGGYLVNPADRERILTSEFQLELAARIVAGTDAMLSDSP